jgi:hypothetical protein
MAKNVHEEQTRCLGKESHAGAQGASGSAWGPPSRIARVRRDRWLRTLALRGAHLSDPPWPQGMQRPSSNLIRGDEITCYPRDRNDPTTYQVREQCVRLQASGPPLCQDQHSG